MITIYAENALKSIYLDTMTELLNTKTNPLLTKIAQATNDVWGKEIRTGAHIETDNTFGVGNESGELPAIHGREYIPFVSTLKNLYGQIKISDKAIRAASNGAGAFTDLLNAELESLSTTAKFNIGRMLYGDGSGLLATIIDCDNNRIICDTTRKLAESLVVDIYDKSGVKTATARIEKIDRTEQIIAFDKPITLGAGDKLYIQGAKDKEITGIGAIFDMSKPLYEQERNTSPVMQPLIKQSNEFTDIVIEKTIDELAEHGANVDYIAVSSDVKYAYTEQHKNIDIVELDGGFKALSYHGIPLVYDRFIPQGTMYLLDTSVFKLHQLCDWRWLETENGKILRESNNGKEYTATLVKYCDLICHRPDRQGMIKFTENK